MGNYQYFISSCLQETKISTFRELLRGASNMQSQFNSVEQIVLRQLECPVCMEYMRPPITLCANGHNICNTLLTYSMEQSPS